MEKIRRKDIFLISSHSDMGEKEVGNALKRHVYPDKAAWQKFLRLLFIVLGVGFSVAGVVFFFAYNWDGLHRFAKIGIVEGLIVIASGLVLSPWFSVLVKRIILTGAVVLTGVLFAVFGQIYQTGANAYDFFLAWTVFATLWVAVSGFAPLWLLYFVLIQTTLVLYSQQVAGDWSTIFVFSLLFGINTVILIGLELARAYGGKAGAPRWLSVIVAFAAIFFSTVGIILGIFDDKNTVFMVLTFVTAVVYAWGIVWGLKKKQTFYLAAIPFSLITIASAFLIDLLESSGMFLFVSLFIATGVTLIVVGLIHLNKKWK